MMSANARTCLYFNHELTEFGLIDGAPLESFTDRHNIRLTPSAMKPAGNTVAELRAHQAGAVVMQMNLGFPFRMHMKLARRALKMGLRVFMYWPAEEAVEVVDSERLRSYWKHWLFVKASGLLSKKTVARIPATHPDLVKPVKSLGRMFWSAIAARSVTDNGDSTEIVTDDSDGLYQATSQPLHIDSHGVPFFTLRGEVLEGSVFVGLLNGAGSEWLGSLTLTKGPFDARIVCGNDGDTKASLIVANAGLKRESRVRVDHAEAFMGVEDIFSGDSPTLESALRNARPVPFSGVYVDDTGWTKLRGRGAYLRSDFWVNITSGGSYGHTCYVAKELNRSSGGLTCFMPQRYTLLDDMGVRQVIMPLPSPTNNEEDIVRATSFYYKTLVPMFEELRPTYIYERLALGNYTSALLSQRFNIPLIVEYNGSEISMKRSFDGCGYKYESFYMDAEMAVFRQATIISVISEPIRDDLLRRGIDPAKILVNPNGADPDDYAPPLPEKKAALKRELGFKETDRVVGFTGTFGGWHGIDVLAKAVPEVCAKDPGARWLIIGGGSHKPQLDEAVQKSGYGDRVRMPGRVPQKEGARLLGACDIYVSPHNTHMVDSKFFGSPTKLFEYMAMGGGIVASDLEQIGQTLSPAIRINDIKGGAVAVANQRSVLCVPGDVDELVEGVVFLSRNKNVCEKLGENARKAILDEYSWARHVEKVWRFADAIKDPAGAPAEAAYPAEPDGARMKSGGEFRRKEDIARQDWVMSLDPDFMEFNAGHKGKTLVISSGVEMDRLRSLVTGSDVTFYDFARGKTARGGRGGEVEKRAPEFPFENGAFDLVYSVGHMGRVSGSRHVLGEIYRILAPGGRVIASLWAENSLAYWKDMAYENGLQKGLFYSHSMGAVMSSVVCGAASGGRDERVVKVYTGRGARKLFHGFEAVRLKKCGFDKNELPESLGWVPRSIAEKLAGRNLLIKAAKPKSGPPVWFSAEAPSGLEAALAKSGTDFNRWLSAVNDGGRFYVDISDEAVSRLKREFPKIVADTIKAADTVLEHKFNLLGSGPFVPVDPDGVEKEGYKPIDWYLDPVRNLRFPRGIHHKKWDLYKMRPGLADIKYPWELSRLQHFITLGQAHRLTGDGKYAREIFDQIADFAEANPVGVGVNWTCTMDVAIRAANMAMGLALVRMSDVDKPRWKNAMKAVFDHGVFIFTNLENKYEVTSNHFLSNIVGLYYLAVLFMETAEGREWRAFCRAGFEEEIVKQILDDGADYESSVPYHRLVLELFLGAGRLARYAGEPLTREYDARLKKMVDYLLAVMRPDRLMPQSGDADDGRLHIFSEYGSWNPQDAMHIIAPAACYLNEMSWKNIDGGRGAWEAAWWGYEVDDAQPATALAPLSTLLPQSGHAVCREGGNYLLVTNSIVGTKGFGNHKHNDQLGFEWHCGGEALIVDAGSYVYTSDPPARNLFRGTAYHNTVMIDGVEQNEINPEWLFRMFEKANAEHIGFTDEGEFVEYRGRHTGYARLENPVTHERAYRFYKKTGLLVITDTMAGSGEHELSWHFHFAPGVEAKKAGEGVYTMKRAGKSFTLLANGGGSSVISTAWYSPSYGVRVPCQALDIKTTARIDGTMTRWFAIGSEDLMRRGETRALVETVAAGLCGASKGAA